MAGDGGGGEDVYCTLVMSDAYLPGAAVLAHSLRDAGTKKKLACLISQDSLRASTVTELQSLYNYVIPIERIGNPSPANLYLMNRPDLLYTFSKIHLWKLTQFRKIIYIDSDVVALRAPDELFDLQDDFAAAPDVGWPDAFNTGVMVLAPNEGDFHALRTLAGAGNSFDGADQGLLNQYFEHRPWKRLSFTYNCTPSANYQYEPAYRYYKRDIAMVHFIGKDKPWQQESSGKGGGGVHQELLSRWWAVYDRHFRITTSEYTSTGSRGPVRNGGVRQEAGSEQQPAYSATEIPFAAEEPQARGEAIDQGNLEPTPTQQQRKFSAPHLEWDATRAAPPAQSRPEASNFPNRTYEFSSDPQPFRPPATYPEPPKDMWYDIPKYKPRPLPAIFPWEERGAPRPSRVFAEDVSIPPPVQTSAEKAPDADDEESDFLGGDELEVSTEDPTVDPSTPATPWETFGAVNKNAWDEVSGISDYVRALTAFQKNMGNVQVVEQDRAQQHILSPSNEPDPVELIEAVRQRRESLILTDFPSAVERPSLPVTPAPRRRSSFWGVERDEEGEMPGAEGVVEQSEWNPEDQLEQLRRNSLVGPSESKMPEKYMSRRKMPGSSASIPEEGGEDSKSPEKAETDNKLQAGYMAGNGGGVMAHKSSLSGDPAPQSEVRGVDAAQRNAAKSAPTFSEPGFGLESNVGGGGEHELSPTQTREAVQNPTEEEKSRFEAVAEAL